MSNFVVTLNWLALFTDSTSEVPVREGAGGKGEQTRLGGRGKIQKEEGRKLTFSELPLGLRPFIHMISHIVQRPRRYG